jgi:hypothetical protein
MDTWEEEAERLVAALDSLLEGEDAVAALIALGERAIGPLRRFLLEGRPRTVYQPRRWAVQALGGLGARGVLAEYLSRPVPADPQLRFAENAVQNAAVREFLRWPDAETAALLLDLSASRMLAGLVEVFGKLRLVEAIPYLDRALEDDICRLPAEEALSAIGEPAREALMLSATTSLPAGDAESPSSLLRRRSVIRVLAGIGIRREDWPRLRSLLQEEDAEIVVLACVVAVHSGIPEAKEPGISRLLAVCGTAPWFVLEDVVECLLAWFDAARPAIEGEIERRMSAPLAERVQDQCLRLLLRVRAAARISDACNGSLSP